MKADDKGMIKLRECAGWSVPCLPAYGRRAIYRVVYHIISNPLYVGVT